MTREEAIKVIRKMLAYTDLSVRANLTADMVDACHMAIKALEQEPKKGHWMGDSYGYICSNCEHCLNDVARSMDYISFSKPKYCPNCGAKMESEG